MTLTQILQKIREAFYTKKEIDSMGGSSLSDTISQKADKSDLSKYLPLSGGQMTSYNVMGRNVTNSHLQIAGGTYDGDGAFLSLAGKDFSPRPGTFFMVARTADKVSYLQGTPDGSLTWNGKDIDVIEEQGDGYIRYTNGIQICWGQTNCSIYTTEAQIGINANAYYGFKYVNFSSAFKAGTSPYCTLTVIDTANGIYGSCTRNVTNAQAEIEIYGPNHSVSLDVQYIAIGRWK